MKFFELDIPNAMLILPDPFEDIRGSFTRLFSAQEFAAFGLVETVSYTARSMNYKAGTIRGLHYQRNPAETKLITCLRGAIYEVIVDLRPSSPQFRRWCAVTIEAETSNSVLVPKGCAHGFQTLSDHTEIIYHIDVPYVPEEAAGIRWDDPCLAIEWPLANPILSERDRGLPCLV